MTRRMFAIYGIGVFLLSISIGLYLYRANLRSQALDQSGGALMVDCFHTVQVDIPKRLMSENESQAIKIILESQWNKECEIPVTIYAPNFDISPIETSQSVKLPPEPGTAAAVWILSPRKSGTFEIYVQGMIIGITVTNPLGLSPWQAQLLSYVGSFFGPMLTLPWWYERWQERKAKKKEKKSPTRRK